MDLFSHFMLLIARESRSNHRRWMPRIDVRAHQSARQPARRENQGKHTASLHQRCEPCRCH